MNTPDDPFAEREKNKYERPIASRELILKLLEDAGGPLTRGELAEQLQIESEDELEALRRRLRAMERDGQVLRNRRGGYLPVSGEHLIRGRVSAHPDGFGFLIPEDGGDDLFLSPKEMRSLLHGDRAVARIIGVDRRGRREGALVEVIERAHKEIVGRYAQQKGVGFIIPDNKRIHQDVMIPPGEEGEAQDGDIVVAAIIEQPNRHSQPIGRVVEVLGEHMAPGMEIDIALRSHELPHVWPDAVLAEMEAFGDEVPEDAKAGRVDLCDTPLVTIDGADARDFDDAVYCEPAGDGWKLIVAIADVSAYVQLQTALDAEAYERATSVYFPKQVIPMLPEVLSNGLCSINPKVDRLCMVCEMQVDAEGNLSSHLFYEGVMRSHARLTYDEVAEVITGRETGKKKPWAAIVPQLHDLNALYQAFRAARTRRGSIDFETTETYFEFDESRKIAAILPRERNDAHRLIEECMIAANVSAARFLKENKIPALYRVHDGPKPEKVEELREFLAEFGLSLGGGEKPSPKDYAAVVNQIQGRPDYHLIQTVLLRSLSQAVYSPDTETGHFGLAQDDYTHFTSPIRRYPDLLVHRAIRHIVQGGTAHDYTYKPSDMVEFGEHCSMCERRADDATRDVEEWLKCEYMMDRVGETFMGTITGVAGFGLFLELDKVFVEGMLHITALPRDYYDFDPVGHRLVGKRAGRVFRLGDQLEVIVSRVDLDERKIDFDLAELEGEQAAAPAKKRKKPGKKKRKSS
ncbi:MAG: ribonuclease R [Thiotrichales bacterium]